MDTLYFCKHDTKLFASSGKQYTSCDSSENRTPYLVLMHSCPLSNKTNQTKWIAPFQSGMCIGIDNRKCAKLQIIGLHV